jgi:DNA-binding transcriptional regulator YhcF (GntR family)/predicted kinase
MTPRTRLTRSDALHQQVARHIRNEIEAGVLRHGDVLPSTRELAAEWETSVYTISEAMNVLVDEGLVVTKSRSKRVVNAPDQASRAEIRLRKPHVIFIGGYAGSGKSELGRILARATGWPLLDKDTITRPIVEAALEMIGQSPHDRESEKYLELIRPREYECLAAGAMENVECGNSAILAAPFIREFGDEAWVSRTQAAYDAKNAVTTFVWVYCDASTMQMYIRHRGAARDAAKLADWDGYVAGIDIDLRPPVPHVLVNNCTSSKPLQEQARELLASVIGDQPN